MRIGLLASTGLVALILLGSTAAVGSITRSDTGVVQDRTLITYSAQVEYGGQDSTAIRIAASGGDNETNTSDAQAYVESLREAMNGSAAMNLSWDGTTPTWTDLDVSQTGLDGNGKVTITFAGKLQVVSSEGEHHTFTILRPSTLSSFSVGLSVPGSWRIVGATGLTIGGQSNNTLIGTVAGTLAVIEVAEQPPSPPPPPPPENDTTPPVVNAGSDQTVTLGEPVYFSGAAQDDDPEFWNGTASFWWTFAYNNDELNFTGQNMSFTFWALGQFRINFTAMDASGNRGTDSLILTVESPDQEPPQVFAGEDRPVFAGGPVQFVGEAYDNDPDFPDGARFRWTFVYNGSEMLYPTSSFSFIFWVAGNYTLSFEAIDFWGNTAADDVVITVELPDTVPPDPQLGEIPTAEAGVPFTITGDASDNDPDFVYNANFSWLFEDGGQAVIRYGRELSYTFETVGNRTIAFTVVDGWGNRADIKFVVEVIPPDPEAPVVTASGNATATVGKAVRLVGTASDDDPACPEGCAHWWTFTRDGVDQNVTLQGTEASYTFQEVGNYTAWFWANDSWGNVGGDFLAIRVVPEPDPPLTNAGTGGGNGPPDPESGDAPPGFTALSLVDPTFYQQNPLVLVGLLGLGALGALGLVAARRRSSRAALEAAPAAPAKPSHVVEAVLLLHRDGRLIHFQASGAEAAYESPEVIGSMFTAVTEFIRDSFGKDGSLSRLTYGQNTIVLDRSKHLFGAVIVYGDPDKQLGESLTDTLRRLEVAYAGLVERWNGDREAFEGIDGFVSPLIALTAGLSRADVRAAASDKTVRLGSGTEHYKGYIRLRVAMVNQTEQPIQDARITVLFNQSVLRLARIEPPALRREGFTVHLGDIGPGERLGASYYLDPQTCSQTNIEGVGTYTDAAGDEKTVKMKTRMAEIVCPLFFTPQHANPAMMRRLIDTALDARDARVYRIKKLPDTVSFHDLFNLARESVQRHHVVLVRNIKQRAPFEGNAWFYGQTKHSRSPVVIRVTVSEKRRTAEFFVAVDSPATLTGMLAEFQRSFTEIMKGNAPTVDLEQVMDDSLKAVLSTEGLEPRAGDGGEPAPRDKGRPA